MSANNEAVLRFSLNQINLFFNLVIYALNFPFYKFINPNFITDDWHEVLLDKLRMVVDDFLHCYVTSWMLIFTHIVFIDYSERFIQTKLFIEE